MISTDKLTLRYRKSSSTRLRADSACRMQTRLSLLALPVLLVWSLTLLAQEQSLEGSSPSILDTLQITDGGDDTPRTGDVVQDEHTGSISSIGRERLDQPGTQLSQVLSISSGVQQRQSGGFGTFSSTTLRGASSASTAVYLDGILLNSAGEPAIDLSTLESLGLQSVDIFKGSTPLQLGHAAMGGAINLQTLGGTGKNETRVQLGLGSFSHQTLSASSQLSKGKWYLTSAISQQQSDNDFAFINDNGTTSSNQSDDFADRRNNNQATRTSALLKGGWTASTTRQTNVLFKRSDRRIGVPETQNFASNSASFDTVRQQLHVSQTIDQWYGWNTKYSIYWHQADNFFDDRDSDIGLGAQAIDTDNQTLGASMYWERFIDAGTFGLSFDVRDEKLNLVDETDEQDNLNAERISTVVTSHIAILDDNDRWLLTPALRWQTNRQSGGSSSADNQNIASVDSNSELGAQLGAEYSISPTLTFNANAGQFYREPSFSELFGSTGLINGNPTLEHEEGLNLDAGLAYQSKKLNLAFTVFHNLHDELIVTTFDARGIGRATNTGESRVTGIELSTNWKPSPRWLLAANATFQSPENRNPFSSIEGNLLPGEAKQTAFARIEYKPNQFSYWYEWQSLKDRFFDDTNLLPAEDSNQHSIGADFSGKHWNVGVSIKNIDDENIEDFNGFPKPGRHGFISLTYAS